MVEVAVIGMGYSGFSPSTPHLSFREMVYEAAKRAYIDAGDIDPRRDIDAFVSCQEDFWEGVSISDEFAPEQIGGVLKPVYTVAGDGLQCIASAVAMIKSGAFDVVAVEAHGKPSEISTLSDIVRFSFDPIYVRPLDLASIHALQAIEARAFMDSFNISKEALGLYVVMSRRNGLRSSRASHASEIDLDTYMKSDMVSDPLSEHDIAPFSDAAIVAVLASDTVARGYSDDLVWVRGVGFASDIYTYVFRDLSIDRSARIAADKAYKMAGIDSPKSLRNLVVELDERYSYKALQTLISIGLAGPDIARDLESGVFNRSGAIPVNPGGGALSEGVPLEAHGLARLLSGYEQLKGRAGSAQIDDAENAIIHGWRGFATATSSIVVLSR